MTPIDIQVSRSKVKVKGHAYSLYVGEGGGGALVFYKHIYLFTRLLNRHISMVKVIDAWSKFVSSILSAVILGASPFRTVLLYLHGRFVIIEGIY